MNQHALDTFPKCAVWDPVTNQSTPYFPLSALRPLVQRNPRHEKRTITDLLHRMVERTDHGRVEVSHLVPVPSCGHLKGDN